MNDPFVDLIVEALNLTHPRFALAYGREYDPADAAAARCECERPFLLEFFHQFRHLWERGLPGRLGLGHIVIQGEPTDAGPLPDLLVWQLGERGQPHRRLGAMSVAFCSNPEAVHTKGERLAHFRKVIGYPQAVNIVVGSGVSSVPQFEGVTNLFFDTDRWLARVMMAE